MLFTIMLISAIFEKVIWNVAGFRISLFMIVGIFFFVSELFKNKGKFFFDFSEKRILIAKLAMIGYILFQTITVDKSGEMLNQYTKGLIALVLEFIIIFAAIDYIHRERYKFSFSKMINLMFFICSINTIYCIAQRINPQIDEILVRITHSTVTRYGLDAYGQLGRITGLFTDSSNNGVFLVFTLLVVYLYLGENSESKARLFFARIIGILSIISLVLTFSLTAYIGLFILIIGYFIHNNLKKQLMLLIGIVCALVAFGYIYKNNIFIAEIFNDKISRLLITFTNSRNGVMEASHFGLIIYSLKIWTYSVVTIIFGTGYNCMNIYFERLFGLAGYKAHNIYLQNLAELGFFGFVLFIIYLISIYKLIDHNNRWRTIIDTFFIALLVMNVTYDSMAQNMFYLVLFLLVTYHEQDNKYDLRGNYLDEY